MNHLAKIQDELYEKIKAATKGTPITVTKIPINKEMEEGERLHGFSIIKRKLTEEETDRDITIERVMDCMADIGEDLFDQCGNYLIGSNKVFGGYLLAVYPERASEILEVINDDYGEPLDFLHLFEEDGDNEEGITEIYSAFVNFANLTKATKRRTNQILIQINEHYHS